MGKTNRRQLKRNDRGVYRAAVGKHSAAGKLAKTRFSLGGDLAEAERRLHLIQHLWTTEGAQRKDGTWDETALTVARAYAEGRQPRLLPYPFSDLESDPPHLYARAVDSLQGAVPIYKAVHPPDPHLYAQSVQALKVHVDETIKHRLEKLSEELGPDLAITKQAVPDRIDTTPVKDAFRKYKENRVNSYTGKYQGKQTVKRSLDHIVSNLPDLPLFRFGYSEVKQVVDFYRQRPATKHGKRCSFNWAGNQIDELYRGLKAIASTHDWSLPDLKSMDRTVALLHSDKIRGSIEEKHWSASDLRLVYRGAKPLTKLIIGLGLNAAAGPAELGRFRVEQFSLNCTHRKAEAIGFLQAGSFLSFIREKPRKRQGVTEVLLWPWVAELVEEQIDRCKRDGCPYLLQYKGKPFYRDNDVYEACGLPLPNTGSPQVRFVSRFKNAVEKAQNTGLLGTALSIGKLRKTLPNYLTSHYSEELGSLLLAHGAKDSLLGSYANRPYARLFAAIQESEQYWRLPE